MQRYNKAIMAILGGLATLAGIWGINIDPEIVAAVGTIVTAVLVERVPNK